MEEHEHSWRQIQRNEPKIILACSCGSFAEIECANNKEPCLENKEKAHLWELLGYGGEYNFACQCGALGVIKVSE